MRICSFNVHEWVGPDGRNNLRGVAGFLLDARCDLVALQEVYYGDGDMFGDLDPARELAEGLGLEMVVAEADHDLANVILTRAGVPDDEDDNVSLYADGDPRSAAVCVASVGGVEFRFFATHLNHLRESTRVKQLRKLRAAVERLGGPCLIAGDFNSLRMSDYGPREREAIVRSRERGRVEEAKGDVMAAIDDAGWIDLARWYDAGGSLGDYVANLGSPIPNALSVTTPYGTRVDYAFATRDLAEAIEVKRFEVADCGASDHRPVVLDIGPRSPSRRRAGRSPRGRRKSRPATGDDGDAPRLYHGTCRASAEALLEAGWKPRAGARGPNGGDPAFLYVSTGAPDAAWFAEQIGCDVVLRVRAPLSALGIDPEDSMGSTVQEELAQTAAIGLPAKLTVRRPLRGDDFELVTDPWSEPDGRRPLRRG